MIYWLHNTWKNLGKLYVFWIDKLQKYSELNYFNANIYRIIL